MTVLNFGAPGVNALIFCNNCGAISIDTPAFGWKRYRHKDIDITVCHHCPTCQDYTDLVRLGLIHGVATEEAVTYENWESAK